MTDRSYNYPDGFDVRLAASVPPDDRWPKTMRWTLRQWRELRAKSPAERALLLQALRVMRNVHKGRKRWPWARAELLNKL